MPDERVARQLAFLAEADKLKTVLRRTPITDGSRAENSAEHSWHLVMFAMTLAEYGPPLMNVRRVLELLTVHDLVEIDAGDTFAYDTTANATKADGNSRRRNGSSPCSLSIRRRGSVRAGMSSRAT
jgi:putative hydrolase of HD superfamily